METCPRWQTQENTLSLLEARVSHRGLLAPAEPEATGSASFGSAPFRPTGKTSLLLNVEKKRPETKGFLCPSPTCQKEREIKFEESLPIRRLPFNYNAQEITE